MSAKKGKRGLYGIALLLLVILLAGCVLAVYVGVYVHDQGKMPFLFGKTLYVADGIDASVAENAAILTWEDISGLEVGDRIVIPSQLSSGGVRAAVGYVSDLTQEGQIGYVGADGEYLRYIAIEDVYGCYSRALPGLGGLVEFAAGTFGMIAFGLLAFIMIVLIAICIAKLRGRPISEREAEEAFQQANAYGLDEQEREKIRRRAVYPELEDEEPAIRQKENLRQEEPQQEADWPEPERQARESHGQRHSKQIRAVTFEDNAEAAGMAAFAAGEGNASGGAVEQEMEQLLQQFEDSEAAEAVMEEGPEPDEEPAPEIAEDAAEEVATTEGETEEEPAAQEEVLLDDEAPFLEESHIHDRRGEAPRQSRKGSREIVVVPPLEAVIEARDEEPARRRPDVNGLFLDDTAEMVVEGTDSQMEKLAELIDKTVKRRGNESVIMDLFYEESKTKLKIRCGWKDVALVSTIIATLMERSRAKSESSSEGRHA